jgi:hypothetical protein
VTRGAPGAALRREAGAGAHGTRAGPGATLSREVGTGAAVTLDAPRSCPARPRSCPEPGGGNRSHGDTRLPPELPCARRRVLPRSGLLLVVSGDFFLVASYCPTKHSRVLKKRYSSAFSPPPLLLRSRRHHGFFFDFFRPCPNVAMSGALQRHQVS